MQVLKMSGRKRLGWTAAVFTAVVAVTGTAIAQAPDNQADLILGSGSDTTYPVLLDLDALYNASEGCYTEPADDSDVEQPLDFTCAPEGGREPRPTTENADHDVALSAFPLGSSNGIAQVAQQGAPGVADIDYARSSRSPRDSDPANLRFVAFAQDAISFITFPDAGGPSAGVTNLDAGDVESIFATCEIRDWRQVEGSAVFDDTYTLPAEYSYSENAATAILVYAAQSGSGTRSTFDGFIDGSSDTCIEPGQEGERVVFENDARLIDEAERGNAISYFSFGRFQTDAPAGSDVGAALGSVDGFAPTPETISDGSFPYARRVYNVYDATPETGASDAARRYVSEDTGWLCKTAEEHEPGVRDQIAAVIAANGFVPFGVGAIEGGVTGESHCRVDEIPAA